MSQRRRKDAAKAYGALRLVCPAGHHLKPRILRIDPPLSVAEVYPAPEPRYALNPGIDRVDAPDGRTKLKTSCAKCRAAGRNPDLQLSWERIRPLLDEVHADPTRGVVDFRIGG